MGACRRAGERGAGMGAASGASAPGTSGSAASIVHPTMRKVTMATTIARSGWLKAGAANSTLPSRGKKEAPAMAV